MKPAANEGILKAEGDWGTATREMVVTPDPNFDAVCFHAQQCAEKYLKALLVTRNIEFPRTHDLAMIADLAGTDNASLTALRDKITRLSAMAVEVRYPGTSAERADAEEAILTCGELREALRQHFQL